MKSRDDQLDAAWRAASREEPPAALDDAIRAAARREVGAGPSRARHMRSWPLAAAAVVTVLAVGIVQLTPPEQVTPTIVADSTLRQAASKEQDVAAAPPAAPAIDAAAPSGAAQVAATSAPVDQASSMPRKQMVQPSAAPPPAPTIALADKTPAPSGAGATAAGAMTPARDRDFAGIKAKLEAAAPESNAMQARAEPFPAAPMESKKAADAPVAPPLPMFAASSKPAPAPSVGTARVARASRADEVPAAPTALAKVAPEGERAKDSAVRPPDEWIKLIRRLQGEGRKEDVAKELAAFRAAYKDRADALLPTDLREAK